LRDADGRVWLGRRGHADLLHPWARVEFRAVRFTATQAVLILADRTRLEIPHDRVFRLEFEAAFYRPGQDRAFSNRSAQRVT
jgi:hypothetical protein